MKAGRYSFVIEQGTTTYFEIQYTDSNNEPVDLTGFHGRMQIRPDYADFTDELYVCISSSIDVDGETGLYFTPTSGSIGVKISAKKTEEFDFDEGYYDLELYSGSYVGRLLEGQIRIRREVTRHQC